MAIFYRFLTIITLDAVPKNARGQRRERETYYITSHGLINNSHNVIGFEVLLVTSLAAVTVREKELSRTRLDPEMVAVTNPSVKGTASGAKVSTSVSSMLTV